MKKIYSFEDFQDSTVYLNNSPSKFITRSLIILFIIFMAVIISIFFIKKTDYIKSTAVITPKNNPINITTDKDIKVKKLLKDNGEL
ncbi:HlyD family secretion protein, partial [Staphylococcus aureus]